MSAKRTNATDPTDGAQIEARRMLATAFGDVSPDDAQAFKGKGKLDGMQFAAFLAVAQLVRRFDRRPE